MKKLARRAAPSTIILVIMVLIIAAPSSSQTTDATALSYQAFSQLATVYASGGSAPNLVARLNSALALISEARVKLAQGDASSALTLEAHARTIIEEVAPGIPTAQQEASQATRAKTELLLAEGAVVVLLLTIAFFACLCTWKWYEREKLYEMRIVAKDTKT